MISKRFWGATKASSGAERLYEVPRQETKGENVEMNIGRQSC
jgi:hypothetical protein